MSTGHAPAHVLVALDGSRAAEGAAMAAIQIAGALHQDIRGLYVVDETLVVDAYADHAVELGHAVPAGSRADLVAQFERRGEAVLAWLMGQCRAAGVVARVDVKLGRVWETIHPLAAEATLLAVGRRGNGHATDSHSLGRHFQAIAHQVGCPLLAGGAAPGSLQRLLLAYDGSERARLALAWTARLQGALATDVTVVTVGDVDGDAQALLQAEAPASEWVRYRFLKRAGEPVDEIAALASSIGADCILIGGYRHTAAVEWLVGSTVEGLLRQVAVPILIA